VSLTHHIGMSRMRHKRGKEREWWELSPAPTGSTGLSTSPHPFCNLTVVNLKYTKYLNTKKEVMWLRSRIPAHV
jgi:hypothetical protein